MYKQINTIIPTIIKPIVLPWIHELNCEKNYKKHIKKLPKLLLLHSDNDEIVPINLVYELINILKFFPDIHFIKISGSHNQPLIDEKTAKKINYVYNL